MKSIPTKLKTLAVAGMTMALTLSATFAEPVAEVTNGGVTTQHDTLPAAFEAIGENGTGTVKLLADINLGVNGVAYVPTGSDFTLDLNGKRIFQTEDEDLAPITYRSGTNGKLTIDDSVGGGGITVNRADSAAVDKALNLHAVCCGGANGELIVNGGTFAVTNNCGSSVLFYKEGNGTWTFNGGTYLAGSEGACSAQFLFCWGSTGKTYVTGGTYAIEAKDDAGIGIYVANAGTEQIEITGGDFDISTGKGWSPAFEFYGTCVVKGGTFDITSTATGAIGFNVKDGGLLIVSNGTFSVSAANNAANCLNATYNSRLEVAGGTFSAVSGTAEGYVSCSTIVGNQGSSVVITGAPVINQPTGGANDTFMVCVSGAWLDFTGYTSEWLGGIFVSNEGNTGFVKGDMSKCWWLSTSGGHFSTRPGEGKYWCANDMRPVVNLDAETKAEYPWVIGTAIAELVPGSGTNYTCVADALTAASDGETVKLIVDVTENISIASAKTNTLDLAGHVLNGMNGDETNSVIQVVEGGLTVSDSNPASVHYFKVDTNGVWVWQADFSGTEDYTFSIADGLQANGATTDDIPTTNDVIAVKGGVITGGTGTPEGTTTYGGGVCVLENGALTVNGGTIVGNRIAGKYVAGGGIYIHGMNGGQYTLTGCAFVGNVGGGLYCNYGAYALTSCHASYNHAPDGGGVYLKENGTAVIKDVKFIGNVVASDADEPIGTLSGGGINARGALVLSDCVIRGNFASYGGGMDIWETAAITNCIVANNTASENSGGIVVSDACTITVKGGEISGNAATGNGGGMYVTSVSTSSATAGCKATLIDVVLSGNSAANGGAICQCDTSELLMRGCTVTNNTATTSGGGICKFGDSEGDGTAGKCVLMETVVVGNASGENGGGVYFRSSTTCLAAGTLVTMADGTVKAIEDVKEGDFVRTFDHEGGTNSTAQVYLAYQGETKETPFTLAFDNGCTLSIVGRHDLLLQDTRKYVTITESNVGQYLGAKFYGEDGAWHTLTNVTRGTEAAAFYSIYTTPDRNVFANGLLTVSDDADFLLNLYELDENLKADSDRLAADIAEYGICTHEEAAERFLGESLSSVSSEILALYDVLNVKYYNIAVGKQLVTWAFLQKTFAACFDGGSATPSATAVGGETPAIPKLALTSAPLLAAAAEPTLDDFDVGVLTLGAGAVVTNNTANGAKSNIHLVSLQNSDADSLIQLTDSHAGICAGVSCSWTNGQFTTANNVSDSDVALFTSDDPMYRVKFVDDHLELTYLDVAFAPTAVDHTTAAVYVNGSPVEKSGDAYVITSNETAAVIVYTAADGYAFADGTTAKTNTIDTSVNPAMAEAPAAPVKQLRYVAPVYVGGIAAQGIDHWVTNTVPDGYTVVADEFEAYWGAEGETRWYVVTNDVEMPQGVVCEGHVNLLLCSGAKLTIAIESEGESPNAGIQTDEEGSFTIYGEPDGYGELTATAGTSGAGIGGRRGCAGANITINGGKVTATGGSLDFEATSDGCGAGIGGGAEGIGANITINGGEVTARGFCGGAGIGGGYCAEEEKCRDIVINGGVVIALSGDHSCHAGAGIGSGGYSGGVAGITINGGTVWVHGGVDEFPDGSVCIGASGPSGASKASDVTIAADANVMFDLMGMDGGLIGASLPELEGFCILTPEMAPEPMRVLVTGMDESGAQGLSSLPAFALTNAVTGATNTIAVGGAPRRFASANLKLQHADSQLALNVFDATQVGEDAWADVENGACTIFGTGDMWDADEWTDGNPLAAYRTSITNVTVNSGVTSIGSQFFHKFYGLNSVSCAESVTKVGDHAFLRCNSLETMNFAATPTFGCDAFKIQAAIRMNGDVPEVYSIPAISVGENAQRVMGKKDLADENWTDVTNMKADEKRLYHFFQIVVQ